MEGILKKIEDLPMHHGELPTHNVVHREILSQHILPDLNPDRPLYVGRSFPDAFV